MRAGAVTGCGLRLAALVDCLEEVKPWRGWQHVVLPPCARLEDPRGGALARRDGGPCACAGTAPRVYQDRVRGPLRTVFTPRNNAGTPPGDHGQTRRRR